jgi:tetratricopeptide (TPR) repeat protein
MNKNVSKRFIIVLFSYITCIYGYSNQTNDSLLSIISKNNQDSSVVLALNELAWNIQYQLPDSSIILSEKALDISKKINWHIGIGKSYNCLGWFYVEKGHYQYGLDLLLKAEAIFNETNNQQMLGKVFGNIGVVYWNQGNYPEALKYYYHSLAITRDRGDSLGYADNLIRIGLIHYEQLEYKQALSAYFQATKIYQALNNKPRVSLAYGNIGLLYQDKSNNGDEAYFKSMNDTALQYYHKALKIDIEERDIRHSAYTLGNLGIVHQDLNQLDSALYYQYKTLEVTQQLGIQRVEASTLSNIAVIYQLKKNYNDAETNLFLALKLAKELNVLNLVLEINLKLVNLYEEQQKYNLSLTHFKNAQQLKDSIFNESKSKEIGKLEATYEIEKKQVEEERLKQEQEKRELEEKERRDNIQYSLIFLAILTVFGIVLGSGKFNISPKFAEGLIFFAFLIFFEFCLVLLDPYIDDYSGGEPAYKLLFNAVLAGAIFPVHAFFENTLKKKILKK